MSVGIPSRFIRLSAILALGGLALATPARAEHRLAPPVLQGAALIAPATGEAMPYDPVAHALAQGLTAKLMDAAFERALSAAKLCPTDERALLAPAGCAAPFETAAIPLM